MTDATRRSTVSAVVGALRGHSAAATRANWLAAVAKYVSDLRPDLAPQLVDHVGVTPSEHNVLRGMTIGEIGVIYEALTALTDRESRKANGQYFTPDDVSEFMAAQSARFPEGVWLDPCCGVGNLSFALLATSSDAPALLKQRLVLIDRDKDALRSAAAILVAHFAASSDLDALPALMRRSVVRDFLAEAPLPDHDFVIVNPPYSRTSRDTRFTTGNTGELYAYFLEKVILKSRGFIAITPASHLGGRKYATLRNLLDQRTGGDVVVFDNVPDTVFRGFKYGSTNSSKTNFVRAAITVSAPADREWLITPILRWATASRARMFEGARGYLRPLRKGPDGEWAKLMPGTEAVWSVAEHAPTRLKDILVSHPTEWALYVASTPRYYVSAARRRLDRGSQHTLFFANRTDLEYAYVLLNSSLPYWWWRCLDGGITLPLRVLRSMPCPQFEPTAAILAQLSRSDVEDVVSKLNAGRPNENVRRPRALTVAIDAVVLGDRKFDFRNVFSPDMFSS